MAVDPTIALLTFEELQTFLGDGIADATSLNQDQVERLIDAVSTWFVKQTGRKMIAGSDEHVFDGRGQRFRQLPFVPVTGTPVISMRDTGGSWTVVSATDMPREIDTDSGMLFLTAGNTFYRGMRNWKIAYNYGYAIADVPADLKYNAIAPLVQRCLRRAEGKEGIKYSQLVGGGSSSFDFGKLANDAILDVINNYTVMM